jgi:hypothetical protein
VTFDVMCREADVDFRWKGAISGDAEGVVEFGFDGEAYSTFQRNRPVYCPATLTLGKSNHSPRPGH